ATATALVTWRTLSNVKPSAMTARQPSVPKEIMARSYKICRMRITPIAALLVVASSSLAQTIGSAVPLTNTRYSTAGEAAVATLASNGRTFVAAWRTPTGVRVSRVDGAKASIGVPVGGVTA